MKNVLFVVSEWGYWGEELIGPLEACKGAGYNVEFLTPTGQKPAALVVSMDPEYIDPPLGRSVTTKEMAEKVRAFTQSNELDRPRSLKEWFPQRAYPSSPTYLRDMEAYHKRVDAIVAKELPQYDAMVIVGGSGALIDLANNSRLHDLILGFHKLDKPIAAECYGVTCLAFARDIREKRSLIWGRHVTGHPLDYDYLDGTGFEGPHALDGSKTGFGDGFINFGAPFYPLEYILRDAVGPEGQFIGNVGHETSVIVDYPFITSRSTASSLECGRLLVECLENGLRRHGW
ncbi:type 1 glutamine amidotransferase domain-containing protein [Candidatus Laterigemmans baculatus]|uniref:type 1 glutamine amidotransferase domain-containing protein n=1 Tax=Candidatus Laterigemmans baculatus TaxID=2770505 RepID=UPI0013DC67FA|nr:type 1 glutamine amidotransferase domain-containing protein [Candidatus Laterigemmans baculatus]